jgi:plastocyanin
MRISRILAAELVLLASLAMAGPSLATEYTVTIEMMKFGEVPANLHVGDTVVWQNKDILRHTATARDKTFDVDLPPGTEGKMVLAQAGSFGFFCRFHPGMTGTLVVLP